MEIKWGSWSFTQKLDFWKLPFRCGACHKIGHLWEDYKSLKGVFFQKKKIWVKRSNSYGLLKGCLENSRGERHADAQALEPLLHLAIEID